MGKTASYTYSHLNMNAIETSIFSIAVVLSSELSSESNLETVIRKTQEPGFRKKAMHTAMDIVSNMEFEYILPSWKELKRTIDSFGDVLSYSYEPKAKLSYILENLDSQEIKNMVYEFDD
jgi:hypothetical protein